VLNQAAGMIEPAQEPEDVLAIVNRRP
jgi:hypothetical protein